MSKFMYDTFSDCINCCFSSSTLEHEKAEEIQTLENSLLNIYKREELETEPTSKPYDIQYQNAENSKPIQVTSFKIE